MRRGWRTEIRRKKIKETLKTVRGAETMINNYGKWKNQGEGE
jgi:hypothetical protein